MRKPICAMCGREINGNEHYFIMMRRSVCRECGVKMRHEVHNSCDINDSGRNPLNEGD